MDSDERKTGITRMRHVDRISTLPDDIICDRKLSLLPTKDSIRTSSLSTRWKHLYASVPVFDFVYKGDLGLVSKVLNTLTSNQPHLSKFRIGFHSACVSSDVISWVDTATSRSVETVDVRGICFGDVETPHSLFTCETLVSLRLCLGIDLSVPDVVHLPKLKEIYMEDIELRDGSSVRRLFSSCRVLEKLTLISGLMPNVRVFNVSAPTL